LQKKQRLYLKYYKISITKYHIENKKLSPNAVDLSRNGCLAHSQFSISR